MHSPDEKARRKRREKNNESARRHRERTKKALEELRILKMKEDEWKREYTKLLNERNNLHHFLITHKCASSPEHLQQQFGSFANSTVYIPLYQTTSYTENAQPFFHNHDYSVEQSKMLPRPDDFCLNNYKEWEKPANNQNLNKPTSQEPSALLKYSSFHEFLAAQTGFTPSPGRYTPIGKMSDFWKKIERGQPITPVFEFAKLEVKKKSPLSEVGSRDEN